MQQPGFWSYSFCPDTKAIEVYRKVARDLHIKLSLKSDDDLEIGYDHIMTDSVLALRVLADPVYRQRHAKQPARKNLAARRVLLKLCAISRKVRALRRRICAIEATLRGGCGGSDSSTERGHDNDHGHEESRVVKIEPREIPMTQPRDIAISILGLPGIEEIQAFEGIRVGELKAWLVEHGWMIRPITIRRMMRISPAAEINDGDVLTMRPETLCRGGTPSNKMRWESNATGAGVKLLSLITLDGSEVPSIAADALHTQSEGLALVLMGTWIQHTELRDSEGVVWLFPGRCLPALRRFGMPEGAIQIKDLLVQAHDSEQPLRNTMTILYRGSRQLAFNVGMSEIKIAPKYPHELLLELDPRWATEDSVRMARDNWKEHAITLVASALQKTVDVGDVFGHRSPQGPGICWQARIHLTEEDSLKLLADLAQSGAKSFFIRPARTDDSHWTTMWTIIWSALPDACEKTLLAQIMGVASKLAGHVGVARAYRNLGLRVPWAGVGAARQVLRPRDSAITEHTRDLKDAKSFLMTGVPRGVTSTEMAAACLHIKWNAIPQARMPIRKDRQETWWLTAAENPPQRQFVWQDGHALIEDTTPEEVRKARRADPKKRAALKSQARAQETGQDPLQVKDPWQNAKMPQDTKQPAGSAPQVTWPATSSASSTMQPPSTLDPRVSSLAQRVERLEGETQQLHGKVDGLGNQVKAIDTTMNTQFAEVLRLLGSIQEKKRAAPDIGH